MGHSAGSGVDEEVGAGGVGGVVVVVASVGGL